MINEAFCSRFIDNFSAGTRGSASAENFLGASYAVIFLYRVKTLKPFERHFQGTNIFEMIVDSGSGDFLVSDEYKDRFATQMKAFQECKNRLVLFRLRIFILASLNSPNTT